MSVDTTVLENAKKWLSDSYDSQTRETVQNLIDNDPKELTESFYRSLEFGTGGLRGIMGVGTNRINKYTVGMATQGLANYIKQKFTGEKLKVAIAHDSRNNSDLFAQTCADIFSANGFTVYLFDSLRPTPELSFAIRHFGCHSGVVITASHNPKEYNGYKAYWNDGGQVISPDDKNIIGEVEKIESVDQVLWSGGQGEIITIGEEIDKIYLDYIQGLTLSPEAVKSEGDIKIVFTPIHGTGATLVPAALERCGFKNLLLVEEQMSADGNFPTVVYPNPEEAEALRMALELADSQGAGLVMATDPDADRIGIAVRDNEGKMTLLNGNQTGAILIYYLLQRWKELGKLEGKEFIVKTIVTSDLLIKIADGFGVASFDVLTGFKFIADIIRRNEGKMQFIGGGEESYGFLVGDGVRDKDAVASAVLVAEAFAWAATKGKSLYDLLIDINLEFGYYKESLVSITKKGKEGSEEIAAMMTSFRNDPPKSLAGKSVTLLKDYNASQTTDLSTGEKSVIDLPKSNVLQFILEDGSIISVRPSGTEPKIKFYFSVSGELTSADGYKDAEAAAMAKIEAIKEELKLN